MIISKAITENQAL